MDTGCKLALRDSAFSMAAVSSGRDSSLTALTRLISVTRLRAETPSKFSRLALANCKPPVPVTIPMAMGLASNILSKSKLAARASPSGSGASS